jgi:hypothetical protein
MYDPQHDDANDAESDAPRKRHADGVRDRRFLATLGMTWWCVDCGNWLACPV